MAEATKTLGPEDILRDFVFGYDDTQVETVIVPEWGGIEIAVVGMSGEERAEFLERAIDPETNKADWKKWYPQLIISCAFDPRSTPPVRVFKSTDADRLNKKSSSALERVAKVALRVSGMDESADQEAGKGSQEQKEASTTPSPENSDTQA